MLQLWPEVLGQTQKAKGWSLAAQEKQMMESQPSRCTVSTFLGQCIAKPP